MTLKEQVPDRARLEDKGDHLFKARFNSGTNNDNTDIPKGSYLTAGYGTSFMYHHGTEHEDYPEYTYASDKVLSFYTGGSQFNLFGQSGHIVTHSSVIKPTLKEKLPLLPNPELSLREVPEKPKAPTVTYHFETLSYQPTVRKAVTNEDRVNIQNALISKQSIVRWELQTDALPTGREEMHHYSFKDVLPKGFVLDVEESQKASSNYTLTYDKGTHTVVLQATPETLANMNKNREMAYNVPTPVLLGKVMDENTTYINTFELSINNEYSVHSNVVTVSTPHKPNPEKHNYNKDQKMIDGKAVPKSALNHYALSWDLDQYKGLIASQNDVRKGFYYIEDYPEEALTIQEDSIKVKTEEEQTVNGIKVNLYNNKEDIPEPIKQLLNEAQIQPKGKFILLEALDPEQFYNDYVKVGKSLKIHLDAKIQPEFALKTIYSNKGYQIDFRNGYATNVVENYVPDISPKKDVLAEERGESIDMKTVSSNQSFYCYTITTKQVRVPNAGIINLGNGRYRYLTELECFRLMGFDDEDFRKLRKIYKEKENKKSSIIYKQVGNSVVVDVMKAVLKSII